jgi:hypothetical protein
LIGAIIELEHHDVNIIRRNRYIKGMPKAVYKESKDVSKE